MLLAIDAGNTNVVFAAYDDDGAQRAIWRISTDPRRTADEYAVWLTQLMGLQGLAPKDITAAVIATVVPAALFNLRTLVRTYFHCEALVVAADTPGLGVAALVERPHEVGIDRLVNAASAHETFGGPLVVIDFGTATTFDIANSDGDYIGGVIAPGINLSIDALYAAAAQLPRIAVGRPEKVIGTGTVGAMKSGVFWGYVGLIEGITSRIEAEHGEKMTVIATGGLATLFAPATPVIQHVDPDITLRGLVAIHRRYRDITG